MKTLNRILVCLLMLVMLPFSVVAKETVSEELEQTIIDSCYYGQKIDLSKYDLTLKQLHETYYGLHDAGELAWYAERKYFNYEADQDTGKILTFEPKLLPASRYDRAVYQQRLEEIFRECVTEGMEPWQIALSVHDYLVVHTAYDEFLKVRTGYDLLVSGKTVCAGYTEVYRELLRMAGIPCVSVVSEPMEHTWNLVCLDGKWYHVDVTWDDPVPDQYGLASHDFFLLTDEQISSGENPHYDWVTDITCTDTAYTDAFFRGVYSPICFTDVSTCYLIRDKKFENSVYRRNITTGEEMLVYKEKNAYINIGKGSYYYRHHGLSVWNGRLWLNNLDKVVSMKPDGSDVRTEFTYSARKNKRFIAGCYVYNDTIRYSTSEHGGYLEKRQETIEPTGYHVHSYTQTVTPPGCGVPGYTESACACGITCRSTPVAALEHEWQRFEEKAPTLFTPGCYIEKCTHCPEKLTYPLEKLPLTVWLQNYSSPMVLGGGAVAVAVMLVILFTRKKAKKNEPISME